MDAPRRTEPPQHTGGTETILLVEDEDAVRRICKRVLLASGYQVLEARDGEEALEQVARSAGKLDLLITDLVMPRIGGRQLAAKLRVGVTRLRVLFLSGYTEDLPFTHELGPTDGFLQKPFTPLALSNKVRALLDADPSPLDGVDGRGGAVTQT